MNDDDILLDIRGVTKKFPGVVAVDNVNFQVSKGEIHVLVGENGAGKSTLMKILTGVYSKDEGKIFFDSEEYEVRNPGEALQKGISMIYQEFNLAPHLTVEENIALGQEPLVSGGWLNSSKVRSISKEALSRLNVKLNFSPSTSIKKLGYAERQLVEIAKALSADAKLVIMDEPTAALPKQEIKELFSIISRLKIEGISVIFISHQLEEVFEIGDRLTVLRDGRKIATKDVSDVNIDSLIQMMVGREIKELFPKEKVEVGEECLSVKGLTRKGFLHEVSFSVSKGEILGIAGLVGAGRTELARAIFGADPIDKGNIFVDSEEVKIKSPQDAISVGIGLLTEDRRNEGLALDLSVKNNITLADLREFVNFGWINHMKENVVSGTYKKDLMIRCRNIYQLVKFLSGGNQQKVVVAKWLLTKSKVLIFDEPTKGIDVGAKAEMFGLMNKLSKENVAIIMISSYLPEILAMSDRILVMCKGKLTAELKSSEADQEKILYYATIGEKLD